MVSRKKPMKKKQINKLKKRVRKIEKFITGQKEDKLQTASAEEQPSPDTPAAAPTSEPTTKKTESKSSTETT